VIRFVRRYKYTLILSLVFAALTTWMAWRGDWSRIGWAAAYGAIVAAQVTARDLTRWLIHWWDHPKRGGSRGWR
jgi:hypothetical protein